ncbi:MAG: alcohol dehydrogenase catalytic domain-containing protein [Thermodesulfovibrionales bacterium]|nr:alcohol dehydrogenase catalytic domain-containing protein [Thermodesulfovibrionales bacterium]
MELKEMPVPEPSRGEVLVKIKAALTCGTDLKAYLRGHPMIPMPGVFGHEFSGIIAKAGKGVKGFKEGDEIMAVHSAPCLKCRYCKKRAFNLCENIMQTKVLGAFAEYILLPAHIVKQNLFHKPATLSFEEAAFLEPLSCVVHGMHGLDIKKGDKALIIGTGPIGLLHTSLAKIKGAKVFITARKKERLDFAKTIGADAAFEINEIENIISEMTDGIGFDFVFECTGQFGVWENSVNYVRKGGTVILFGGCKTGTRVSYDTYRLHYDELTLKGAFHFTPQDVKTAYNLLKETINVSPLISGHYSLKDLHVALERLSRGEGIKYAVTPD